MPFKGELAALMCAFTWSVTALAFTSASRRVGSFTMSHYRMLFGIIILVALLLIFNGRIWPTNISNRDLALLATSGFMGFFVCDVCLFQSYMDLGPRLGALIFNIYPFFSAFMAWVFLSERLSRFAWLGMAVTIAGVIWVVLEHKEGPQMRHPHFKRGIFLGICAAVFQSIGMVFAKPTMGDGGVDPLVATFIRAIFGGSAYWLVSLARGRLGIVLQRASDKRAMKFIAVGAFFGPSFGVWLMMLAIKYSPVGIASTIMALMPVTILPFAAVFYKEKITWRMVIGAIVACLGVAILFNT